MSEPQTYLNGRYLPASQATLPVFDGGLLQGATVSEQLRTFAGELFRLEPHVERLLRSLAIVGVDPGLSADELAGVARELVGRNYPLLPFGHDLALAIFVTPGPYAAMTATAAGPTVCMHSFPLRFELWADKYQQGESLATTDIEQVSPRSWPPELKCRSRMHYYLADREARARFPGSRALMLDEDGFITETTTSNLVLFNAKRGLETPPAEKILPGISLAVLLELADQLDVPVSERDLTPADVTAADEAFVTSTSVCMLAVTRFNGQPIGSGQPGPTYQRFLSAWNELAGLDIAGQAARCAAQP